MTQMFQRGDDTLADAIIARLNVLCRNPEIRTDIGHLLARRVPVSEATQQHETLQCDFETGTLGVLGLLNGLCGLLGGTGERADYGFITARYSDDGDLEGFERTKEK